MLASKIFENINARISEAIAASPVRDVEKNVRAMVTSALSRLDLVSREEFEVQTELLRRTREKLDAATERLAELEARLK
ncbi:MAG: accessory factor UbiK family protein [Betaproteobacteria bacterium]